MASSWNKIGLNSDIKYASWCVKSPEIWLFIQRLIQIPIQFPIVLKFDRHLGIIAAEIPVKFESDAIII